MIDQANGVPAPGAPPPAPIPGPPGMPPVGPPPSQSWLDVMKEKFNLENIKQQFDLSTANIVQMSAYFGVGFLGGFLLKRYFLYVIFFGGLLGFGMWWLSSMNVVTFDWLKINELAGIQSTDTLGVLCSTCLAWIQQNVALSISCALGFLFGYRLG